MIFQNDPSHEQPQRRQKALGKLTPNPKATLEQQLHEVMRFFHYSPRTEETYVDWVRRFIVWSGKRHPKEMGAAEVRATDAFNPKSDVETTDGHRWTQMAKE